MKSFYAHLIFLSILGMSLLALDARAEGEGWRAPRSGRVFIIDYNKTRDLRAENDRKVDELISTLRNAGLVDADFQPGEFDSGKWTGKNTTIVLNGGFVYGPEGDEVLHVVSRLRAQGAKVDLVLSPEDLKWVYQTGPSTSKLAFHGALSDYEKAELSAAHKEEYEKQYFETLKGASLVRRIGGKLIIPSETQIPVNATEASLDKMHEAFTAHLAEIATKRTYAPWFPESVARAISPVREAGYVKGIDLVENLKSPPLLKAVGAKRAVISRGENDEEAIAMRAFADTLLENQVGTDLSKKLPVKNIVSIHGEGRVGAVEFGRGYNNHFPIHHPDPTNTDSPSFRERERRQGLCHKTLAALAISGVGIAGVGYGVAVSHRPYVTPTEDTMTFEEACSHAGGSIPSVEGFALPGACLCKDGKSILPFDGERCE